MYVYTQIYKNRNGKPDLTSVSNIMLTSSWHLPDDERKAQVQLWNFFWYVSLRYLFKGLMMFAKLENLDPE